MKNTTPTAKHFNRKDLESIRKEIEFIRWMAKTMILACDKFETKFMYKKDQNP